VGTHSYVDECDICGGFVNVNQNIRPTYMSEECYDCGWWESDQEGNEGSGFMDLDDINNLREMVGMDELTPEKLIATRIRINAPLGDDLGAWLAGDDITVDEHACVINRRLASRDP
jgi:hypothetical protein